MNTIFGIIMTISFFAIPYYVIRRILTKKSKPLVYSKIKKRIWYATALFVIGVIGVTATQKPVKAHVSNSQETTIQVSKSAKAKKLSDARLNVDGLFDNAKHTKLMAGTSYKDIKSVSDEVNALKKSDTKTKLQKDIKKAKALWPAFKKTIDKKAAIASSKLVIKNKQQAAESSKQKQAEKEAESIAASSSAAKSSSESVQRVAESNSIVASQSLVAAQSASVVAAQAASESTRQANEAAASQSAQQAVQTPATPQGETVYITQTGTKYHYNPNCRGLNHSNGTTTISLSDAISRNYTLCKWG